MVNKGVTTMMPSLKKRLSLILATVLLILAATPALASDYVGNSKSKKFHYADCRWAGKISPRNIVHFSSRDEAVNQGYVPCKVCQP